MEIIFGILNDSEAVWCLIIICYLAVSGIASFVGPSLVKNWGYMTAETADSNSAGCFFALIWPIGLLVLFVWKCIWPIMEYLVVLLTSKGWSLVISASSAVVQLIQNRNKR